VHDAYLDDVLKVAEEWRLGDPFDESTLVGPMNNEPTAAKMDRHLEDAVEKGANVIRGGSRAGDRPTNLYYEPTVVTDVCVDTLINREETFGPIVPLIRVRSDEEALAVANDSHLGLQAASLVWQGSCVRKDALSAASAHCAARASSSLQRPATSRWRRRRSPPSIGCSQRSLLCASSSCRARRQSSRHRPTARSAAVSATRRASGY
jgi:hypothetical protein